MLKWLRHKPAAHVDDGGGGPLSPSYRPSGKEANIATTDDPLATFQVQLNLDHDSPGKKKGKLFRSGTNNNKNAAEVYAVSRVNPLFDDNSNSLITIKNPNAEAVHGHHDGDHAAGSSGYDSNSNTNPSDGEDDGRSSHSGHSHEHDGGGGLFQDNDSDLVITRKIIPVTPTEPETPKIKDIRPQTPAPHLGPVPPADTPEPGASSHPPPILINQQNPGYVKSIILAMGGGRTFNSGTTSSDTSDTSNVPTAIGRPLSSSSPVCLSKNIKTVASKFTGGPPPPPPPAPHVPASATNHRNLNEMSAPIRKNSNSTTDVISSKDDLGNIAKLVKKNTQFVHSIQVCPHPQGNAHGDGTVNVGFGKPTRIKQHSRSSSTESSIGDGHIGAKRKPSVTFSELVDVVVHDNPGKKRKKSSGDVQRHQQGLEKFSTSLSKNRMVKQIISKNTLPPPPDDPDVDGVENADGTEVEPDFVYHQAVNNRVKSHSRSSHPHSTKSPFGGIADHYAAAKEIAKEIESYSTGTTKSTKISFVRDLLLSHNNRAKSSSRLAAQQQPISTTSSYLVTPHNLYSTKYSSSAGSEWPGSPGFDEDDEVYPIIKVVDGRVSVVRQPSSSSASSASWKVLQVQPQQQQQQDQQHQVYVKASHHKRLTTPTTTPVTVTGSASVRNNNESEYDYANRGDEGQDQQRQQQQVPIYEALPHSSSNRSHEDSDSGNSTDRNASGSDPGGGNPVVAKQEATRIDDCSSSASCSSRDHDHDHDRIESARESDSSAVSSESDKGKNKSKVMIISGDSQNMVVDLTAVPSELREAIIAGTTLMKLPSTTTDYSQRPHAHQLEPGYTLITIPPQLRDQLTRSGAGPGGGGDDDDEPSRNKFTRHNLTHIWNVMQSSLMGGGGSGGGRKKKDVTTILPFHPNHDSHAAPDFTLEGQRLARQAKRVRNGKRTRCLCRLCGMLVFLISFLGVIVTLSLIYTNGRKYFGSA